jgi:hypothetical protein
MTPERRSGGIGMLFKVQCLDQLTIDQLVARYEVASKAHGEKTMTGTPSSDPDADTVAAVYRELRRRGNGRALLVLLDSPDAGVRVWAGAHSLEFAPAEGEPVLVALAEETDAGLIGFSAETTLREWRAGRLNFP